MPMVIEIGAGKPGKKGGLADALLSEMKKKGKDAGETKASGDDGKEEGYSDADPESLAEEFFTAGSKGDFGAAVSALKELIMCCKE